MEEQALVPIAQTNVTIAGFSITAVLLPEDQTGEVFDMFCQALDLDTRHQLERIHHDPTLFDSLILVALETPGGPQPTNVIYSWAVPLWLAGIRAGARPPAYQERLRAFKREAFRALASLFKQATPSSPSGPTIPAAPAPAVLPAPAYTGTTLWDDWHRLVDRMQRESADVSSRLMVLEEDQHSQHLRLSALESAHARPTIGLSPQRLTHLVFLARQLRQQRGTPIADTLAALAARFQVADASDLPDTA